MRVYFRVLSALLAAALVVLGVLVVIEVILAALNKSSWVLPYSSVASTLRDHSWNSAVGRWIAVVLVVVGLLLLLPALRRGRPSDLPLSPMTDGVDASVDRKGLQRALRDAAQRIDGVSGAKAKVSRRKIQLRAESMLKEPGDLPQRVDSQVRSALQELSLEKDLKIDVQTNGSR